MNSKENSTGASGGARTPLSLIDAIDLLNEAREINEAAFMACLGINDRKAKGALQRLLSVCGDTMGMAAGSLETLRAGAQEGGSA